MWLCNLLCKQVLAGIAGVLSRADSLRSCEDSDAFLQVSGAPGPHAATLRLPRQPPAGLTGRGARPACAQTLSDGICSAPELLRKALPFGTAAAPEALPPAAMLGVAEAVLPLAHTVLLSEPYARIARSHAAVIIA